jgi:enterochelin esterase-like enzyme
LLAVLLLLPLSLSADGGVLSEDLRIHSKFLGYDLQYRVYTPVGTVATDQLPTLYVTDGQAYLQEGELKSVLDTAIAAGDIRPLLAVFIDSRNPDRLQENRRNEEFMCNTRYAQFFATELIPAINESRPVSASRDDRVVLGVSFGGLNSACFGLMLSEVFSGIAMQSPASGEHVEVVRKLYEEKDLLPLKMYLSAGTENDNLRDIRRFRRSLVDKGYDVTFSRVRKGHDWDNWGPLLPEVLATFFAMTD